MPRTNCCFLTCIQVSQEADQVVWYSHLFQNFPQFIVIHTVKGFILVNKAKVDFFFWNYLAFLEIQWMLAMWSLVWPFLNSAWTSGSSGSMYCWSVAWRILSLAWRIFRHTLLFYDCFNHTSGQKFHVNVITSQYQIPSSKSSESVIDETQKKLIYCIKLETKLTAFYGDETSTV